MSRVWLLSWLILNVLIVGCAPRAPEKSGTIRLLVITNTDIRDIPLGLAVESLKAQGYDVEITQMANGVLMTEALAHGDAELGSFNNQTLWTAIAKGVKARTLMQRLNFPNLLVARREVKDCRALNGKPLAIGAQTGLNPLLVELWLERNCPQTKPRLLVVPESTGRAAAVAAGAVDAALLPLEEFLKLQQQTPGQYVALVDLVKAFPLLQVNGVHARTDWLQQNPQAAKDFIRALLLAHRSVIDNPQVLYDKAVEQLKLDSNAAKTLVDAYLAANAWDPNGALTRENIQYTLDFLKQTKDVPAELTFEDVADLSYLNAVLAELGRR